MIPGEIVTFTSLMFGQYAVGDVVRIHGRRYRIAVRDGAPMLRRTLRQWITDVVRRIIDGPERYPRLRTPPGASPLAVARSPQRARRSA